MRPFLLLSSRAEDVAAEGEYEAFLRCTGLSDDELHRIRMEAAPLPDLDLDAYSGLMLGGGPFNSSDPPSLKSAVQHRVEGEMRLLLDRIIARDFPFFGACYGIGTLGVHQGGVIDRTYAEPIAAVRIQLTPEGLADPMLAGMSAEFDAFVGHKEACSVLPPSAVLLASSAGCPVQMFRRAAEHLRDAVPPGTGRAGHRDPGARLPELRLLPAVGDACPHRAAGAGGGHRARPDAGQLRRPVRLTGRQLAEDSAGTECGTK